VRIWADTDPVPSSSTGFALLDGPPSNKCGAAPIGGADGTETWQVEFPVGMTIADIAGGSISIWCETFQADFGHVTVPTSLYGLPATADGPALQCSGGYPTATTPPPGIPNIATTPTGYNCEPLDSDLQVRWMLAGDTLSVELVGRIGVTDYMGFGLSGLDNRTSMDNADATVCDVTVDGTFRARDFFVNDRSQCSSGVGVCPDAEVGAANDVGTVSGEREAGLTLVRYKRSLVGSDEGTGQDRPYITTAGTSQFVVWAIGPVDSGTGNPLFHTKFPRGTNVEIEFGRTVVDNCEPLVSADGAGPSPTAAPVEPFDIPVLRDVTEITANIGPSGGPKGYGAITGVASWGIAWYLNDLLAPILELRRGTTYTFRVNGGNNPNSNAQYHPFYITMGENGGYAQRTPEERATETILAGIENITLVDGGVTAFDSTAAAPICEYRLTNATAGALEGTFAQYFATLDTSCRNNRTITGAAAVLEFTPDDTTPDRIYYQCVTHRNLGYRIRVLDPGETLPPTPAPVATSSAGTSAVAFSNGPLRCWIALLTVVVAANAIRC
jgi:DOMON domain/Electron transfer DM13